jgi:hypothetical protein
VEEKYPLPDPTFVLPKEIETLRIQMNLSGGYSASQCHIGIYGFSSYAALLYKSLARDGRNKVYFIGRTIIDS